MMAAQAQRYHDQLLELHRKAAELHGAERQRVLRQMRYRERRIGELRPGTLWTPPVGELHTPKPGKLMAAD
jgi:hypothetical protein